MSAKSTATANPPNANPPNANPPAAAAPAKSFDENLRELESIVESLEHGESTLEAMLSKYERGVKLHAECQSVLRSAELRIEQLRIESDKTVFTKLDLPPDPAD